jgi:hypothetical protein
MTSDSLPETSGDAAPVLPSDAALSHDPAYIDYATRMLGDAELTDGLRAPQLARLATIGAARSYGPHELICDEQERSDELYIVQDGAVEVLLDPRTIGRADADNRRIAVIGAGQTCGELALLDGGVRSARLRAGGDGAPDGLPPRRAAGAVRARHRDRLPHHVQPRRRPRSAPPSARHEAI